MFWKVLPAVVISLMALHIEAFACLDSPLLNPEHKPEARIFFQAGLSELKAAPVCGPSGERASYPKDELARHYKYDSLEKAEEETLAGWFTIIAGLPPDEAGQEALLNLIDKSTPADLQHLQAAFDGAAMEGPLSDNLAARAIVESANQAALDYLVFTRDLASPGLFGYSDGQWGYAKKQEARPKEEFLAELATRAEAALKIPDLSPQLWMLYAFQLIRIYFYAGEHDLVIEFFENDLAHKPATAPLEWCRSYYGGSLHARDRNVEAFAAFAAVFHRSARYGPSALASLHITDWPLRGDRARPASNEGGKTIYSEPELKWLQTATPEEAALYRSARNFIGGDPHEALAGVLSLIEHGGRIPNNLEEYLVAAIGRMERKAYRPIGIHWHIYTSAPVEYGSDPPDPAPEPDLERRLLKIGAGRPHPALWQLAAAHLAIMRRDEKAAAGYIDTAATNNAGSLMPIQLQITRLLKDAWLKPLDAANERRLADDLSKLDLLLAETVNFYHPGAIARRALWESVLARRFHEAGQDARAFFCLEVVNTRLFNSFNPSAALEKGPHSIRRAENDMDSTEQPRELFTIPYSNALYWAGEYIAMLLSDPADLKEIRRIRLKPEGALELYFQKNVVGWTPRVIDELTGLAYINRFDYQPAIKVLRGISSQGWAQRRYKEKTPLASSPESLKRVLRDTYRRHFSRNTNWNERSALANVNPFRESPASLFGPLWVDDFSALFDAAARAGLSEHSRETILKLSNPPATFLEFAQKMNRLKELSREHGELGATSAYFYALAVYNSAEYPNWRQNCEQYGADQEVDRMLILLVKKTRNRELAARANFIRAAFRKYEAGFTYNRKTKVISYNKFDVIEPYFQVLSGLKDTKFAHDISFHCPSVGLFLK